MAFYWLLPVSAALTWAGTLSTMFTAHFLAIHSQPQALHTRDVREQHDGLSLISEVGAGPLKPLFVAGSTVAVVLFDIALLAEFRLRNQGRLVRYTSARQKQLAVIALVFAVVGAVGLIALTVFDTEEYEDLHSVLLYVFIIGYAIAAAFACEVYRRLAKAYRYEYPYLTKSFWIQVVFSVTTAFLANAFFVLKRQKEHDTAALLEWIISIVFITFMGAFALDLKPTLEAGEKPYPILSETS